MVLAIYGTGGGGKETLYVAERIRQHGNRWEKIVFIDDTKEIGKFKEYECCPYQVFRQNYPIQNTKIHVAIGELQFKRQIIDKVKADGYSLESLIHPHAHIGKTAVLGEGVQVKMGACIGEHVTVGEGTWVQAYATVREGTQIGNWCQISAKATVERNVKIADSVFVGMHAVVASDTSLEPFSIVSMGATVYSDLKEEAVCMGNPGRVMSFNREHKVF